MNILDLDIRFIDPNYESDYGSVPGGFSNDLGLFYVDDNMLKVLRISNGGEIIEQILAKKTAGLNLEKK